MRPPAADPLCALGPVQCRNRSPRRPHFDTLSNAALGDLRLRRHGRGRRRAETTSPIQRMIDTFTDVTETTVLAVNQDFTVPLHRARGRQHHDRRHLLGAAALSAVNPQGTMVQGPRDHLRGCRLRSGKTADRGLPSAQRPTQGKCIGQAIGRCRSETVLVLGLPISWCRSASTTTGRPGPATIESY